MTTPVTRRVGLLGKPLKRRHSPVMHDAAFDAAGIDARYVLLELDADEVEPAVAAARGPEWLGLGVTAPYKRVVAGLVDEVEPDAATIGAVNNVVRTDDGRLIGINTDAPGFRAGVELAMGRSLAGADVVVAGAGGAAHAVVFACLAAGAAGVTIGNRTAATAQALVERFAGVGAGTSRRGRPRDAGLRRRAGHGRPGGQRDDRRHAGAGHDDPGRRAPGARDRVRPRLRPAETPLLAAARARGLRAANGSEMLIAQAAIAFERWTGVGGMADVMREAVAPLLADPTVVA